MLYNIKSSEDIRKVIVLLEDEVEEQKQLLMGQVNILYDNFRPVNVVKDLFSEIVTSKELRSIVLTTTIGISTGYLVKRLLFKKSNNPLKTLTGYMLQYGIANFIVNPSWMLKTILPFLESFSGSKGKEQ